MLLGYASGSLDDLPDAAGWDGTEPYAEIGGLDAELAGILAHLLQALDHWWQVTRNSHTPNQWVQSGRELMAALFLACDETDQKALQALDEALGHWAQACTQAGYEQPLDLRAVRLAWLEALELPSLERRFRAGGVTFCTLMPMRAVPFEVVCLLGMNDGDYPRKGLQSDFDLMALPGLQRPGDRSRRQDDRQLMLEALLSARRQLYLSWTGRSVRDNSEQPPSVLVSQLRDYLGAVWGESVLHARTTAHPLQAFSRRYFEAGSALQTYAREWRSLYAQDTSSDTHASPAPTALPGFVQDANTALTLKRLATFLRNPVKVFFRERLGVVFDAPDEDTPDDEAFEVKGLDNYLLIQTLLQHWPEANASAHLPTQIPADLQRLRRTGVLPMQGLGDLQQQTLEETLGAMARAWRAAGQRYPHAAPRQSIALQHAGVLLQDWVGPIYQTQPPGTGDPGECAWVQREPGKLLDKDGVARPDKLLPLWLHSLAGAASGLPLHGVLVGQDGTLHATPMPQAQAQAMLEVLLQTWLQGMQQPLPLPLKTSLALAAQFHFGKGPQPARVYEGDEHDARMAEVRDSCLAREFPDFEALESVPAPQRDGAYLHRLAEAVYVPLLQWMEQHVQTLEPRP
jgi:exodeoxyribonuclease V gamma subunit